MGMFYIKSLIKDEFLVVSLQWERIAWHGSPTRSHSFISLQGLTTLTQSQKIKTVKNQIHQCLQSSLPLLNNRLFLLLQSFFQSFRSNRYITNSFSSITSVKFYDIFSTKLLGSCHGANPSIFKLRYRGIVGADFDDFRLQQDLRFLLSWNSSAHFKRPTPRRALCYQRSRRTLWIHSSSWRRQD